MQQQDLNHQMMGYDRTSAMFSPDGRLLQVEYAKKTVRQGSSIIGLTCKDGVLLMADKRIIDRFIVPKSVEKIFQIDEHIGATAAGILSDARILIEKAQVMAQQNKITYDEPIDVQTLVKEICNIKQAYTQYGGARPFGVSILFAGVNSEPSLYLTDITGIFFQYQAVALGEKEEELRAILEKEYKETLTVEDGLKLALRALKKVLGKEFDIERIECAYVKTSDKKFTRLEPAQTKKYL
jgi:proteasome alpha subunit